MPKWTWVREDIVLAIHSEQLKQHSGISGIRDIGLLQSALARPVNIAAHSNADIAVLAASYATGITRNHPFTDGNKRTAFVVFELFLLLNNHELTASDADNVVTFLSLAEGFLSEEQLVTWIRNNILAR